MKKKTKALNPHKPLTDAEWKSMKAMYGEAGVSKRAQQALKALRDAVRKVVIERKKSGVSLSIWKDGKVVTIPADKINLKSLGL